MALFLVVEATRKPKDWGGEARGKEGKEKEERKRQGAWLVKSQCIKELHGAGKPAYCRGKVKWGSSTECKIQTFICSSFHSLIQ